MFGGGVSGVPGEENLCVCVPSGEILAVGGLQETFFFPQQGAERQYHGEMITATTWVPKGFAAQFPKRVDVTEEELERIAGLARLHLGDAKEGLEGARAGAGGAGGEGGEEEEDGEGGDGEGSKERRRALGAAEQLKAMEEDGDKDE